MRVEIFGLHAEHGLCRGARALLCHENTTPVQGDLDMLRVASAVVTPELAAEGIGGIPGLRAELTSCFALRRVVFGM